MIRIEFIENDTVLCVRHARDAADAMRLVKLVSKRLPLCRVLRLMHGDRVELVNTRFEAI